MQTLRSYIQKQKTRYETTGVYVSFSQNYERKQYDVIDMIDHYWMSLYMTNAEDDVIGKYPFDNISKYRTKLEQRGTDFDTKHVSVEPKDNTRRSRVAAMIASKAVQEYLRKNNFAKTINDVCLYRPKYGTAVVKRSKDGVHVVPWKNLITDQSDIEEGDIIERHYFTPASLKRQDGWQNLDEAISHAQERKETSVTDKGKEVKTMGDFIEVYELHGEIPLSMLKQAQTDRGDESVGEITDEDEREYVTAMIVVAGLDSSKDGDDKGDEEDDKECLVLYAEEEDEKPYRVTTRDAIENVALGVGVVEDLKEHQKWHNFTLTEEMRMNAIAGKKLYVTTNKELAESGSLHDSAVDHGTALLIDKDDSFIETNQFPTGLPVNQGIRAEFANSADHQSSSYAANLGEPQQGNVPFRAQYLQNRAGNAQFDAYSEEIALFLGDIITDWIMEDALKEAKKKNTITAQFTTEELEIIDETLIYERVTEEYAKRVLEGEVVEPETLQEIEDEIREDLRAGGDTRTIEKIQDFIEDAGDKVVVNLDDQHRDKALQYENYANVLNMLAPDDPKRDAVIQEILNLAGISPERLDIAGMRAQDTASRATQSPQRGAMAQGGGMRQVQQLQAPQRQNDMASALNQ